VPDDESPQNSSGSFVTLPFAVSSQKCHGAV